MLKRITCLIMALLIIISASACSGEDKKKTDAEVLSMTDVQNYEEKDIGASIGLKMPGTRVCLDSKNQLVLNDQKEEEFFSIVADTNGKKLQEYKNDTMNSLFTLDTQDNRYVVQEKYGELKEGDKKREAETSVIIYNSEGKKQKSLDLGKRTYTDKQAGITDIAVDTKGNVYLLQRQENIEVIGADGKKIKDIPAQKTDYIEIDDQDNLFLGSFSGGNNKSSVEKRSLQKEDNIWVKELSTGNYIREMNYSIKNKTLYLLTEKGILACSSDGNIEGFVFDLKQTSLLESDIYITDFLFDSEKNIYILAFKSDSSSGTYESTPLFYKYTPVKDQKKKENQKTLTVALRYSERYMEAAISKFQKTYPDVKVEVKDYAAAVMSSSADGPGEDEINRAQKAEEDFQKNISTELMAGKGSDIIEVSGLPYKKFIDKNTLVNLSEIIKNDQNFDMNKYKQNILKAFKYKDSMYIMPVNFSFTSLGVSKNIKEKEGLKIDSSKWTWKDFLSVAQQVTKDKNGDGKPDQYALPKMTPEEIFSFIFEDEYGKFIDYDKKTSNFDSKEFTDILTFAKEFADKGVCSPKLDNSEMYKMLDPGTIGFINCYISTYQGIIMSQALLNSEIEFLDRPTFGGTKPKMSLIPGRVFAINNNSKLKTEAWDFIKLLISDEIQSNDQMYQFPINSDSLNKKAKNEMTQNYMYKAYKDQGRNVSQLTQTHVDLINKMIDQLELSPYSEPQAAKIVSDGVKEFFSGKKTAEETAKYIQNKMNIYLGE